MYGGACKRAVWKPYPVDIFNRLLPIVNVCLRRGGFVHGGA